MNNAKWFAVRSVFHLVSKNLYEERILLWETETAEEAISLTEDEAGRYCQDDADVIPIPFWQTAQLFDPPGSGQEVFFLMRESELSPKEYVARFFDTGKERLDRLEETS